MADIFKRHGYLCHIGWRGIVSLPRRARLRKSHKVMMTKKDRATVKHWNLWYTNEYCTRTEPGFKVCGFVGLLQTHISCFELTNLRCTRRTNESTRAYFEPGSPKPFGNERKVIQFYLAVDRRKKKIWEKFIYLSWLWN